MSTPDTIAELVKRVSAEAPPEERTHEVLQGIRALPNIEELPGPLAFRSENYEIHVGLTHNLEKVAKNLSDVKSMKLSVAPEVVAHLPYGDGEGVLITRYAAIDGERLTPVRPGQTAVPAAARERFQKDLAALGARGLVHPYASRGFAHWLASSESKTLVLDNWSVLRGADASEASEHLGKVDGLLARLG